MNSERRQHLIDKYGIDHPPMAPAANTQVRATDRAGQVIAQVWGRPGATGGVLFDPARVPTLAERADAAANDYRRRAANGELRWDTADGLHGGYDPDALFEQGAVRIWRVGSNDVWVVRERWRDAPKRTCSPATYTAGILRHAVEQLDYHDCTKDGCGGVDCDLRCNANLAKACGGPTRLLPVDRGTLVLLFRCCSACEDLAGKLAAASYQIAAIEAHERLADQPDPAPAPKRHAPWWARHPRHPRPGT